MVIVKKTNRKIRKDCETVTQIFERLSMPITECGCHAWLGKIGTGGYAYIAYREGNERKHRKAATVALELAGRPRPEGFEVLHSCQMEWCVNPDHLRWGTHSENMSVRKGYPEYKWPKIFCCQYCDEVYEILWNGRGYEERGCRKCRARRAKEWRERTGYDQSKYYAENKDRINAKRRNRRSSKHRRMQRGDEPLI